MSSIYGYATKSWPVVKGCEMTLPCAARCWAKRECYRLAHNPNPGVAEFHQGLTDARGNWTGAVKLNEAHLKDPLRWRKPERVAVAYHGDLFLASDEWIDRVFAVMALCPQHTFFVLTKHGAPARLREYFRDIPYRQEMIGILAEYESGLDRFVRGDTAACAAIPRWRLPLPNVWLGVSVTNQEDADERIPLLLNTPAAKRWISLEPMLGPVNLRALGPSGRIDAITGQGFDDDRSATLDWVVTGGESGFHARPCDVFWTRTIIQQCRAGAVPCFVKQLGRNVRGDLAEFPGCKRRWVGSGSRDNRGPIQLDNHGADPAEWPQDLRVRQLPEVREVKAA